jgi:hypothetical protein
MAFDYVQLIKTSSYPEKPVPSDNSVAVASHHSKQADTTDNEPNECTLA